MLPAVLQSSKLPDGYDEAQEEDVPLTVIAVRNSIWSYICRPIEYAFIVVIYFAVGCWFYTQTEGWSVVDAIYFQMATVSTVGYGDFSPTKDASRVFTVFWILIGILVIFAQLAKAVNALALPIVYVVRRFFDRVCPQQKIDIDGDGVADLEIPDHPLIYYPKQLLAPISITAAVQLGAAATFMHVEGWSFGLAFYHCMVTATTVGYGDVPIRTSGGRYVAIVHIMLSVAIIAMLLAEMADAVATHRHRASNPAHVSMRC